jgi:hypothetical protein
MSVSSDITMTDLKAATGIGSYKLTAHHPNSSTGNQTAMSSFLTTEVGLARDDTTPTSFDQNFEVILPTNVTCLDPGTNVTFRVYADVSLDTVPSSSGVTYYAEQILQRAANLDLTGIKEFTKQGETIGSATYGTTEVVYVDLEYEVKSDGYGTAFPDITVNDPLNDQATNMGSVLKASDVDKDGNSVPNVNPNGSIDLVTANPRWEEMFVTLDNIQTGTQFYEWTCDVLLHDPNDQIPVTDREYRMQVPSDINNTTKIKHPDTDSTPDDDRTVFSGTMAQTSATNDPTFNLELYNESVGSVTHEISANIEFQNMIVGDVATVNWIECSDTWSGNQYVNGASSP